MVTQPKDLRDALLAWYDDNARDLPWRVSPKDRGAGRVGDPYHVWLSEIMLQQTTITTVKPYFVRFLAAFPTVQDLAAASQDEVLSLWAGLGYYARGRNLHKCASEVARLGGFPKTVAGLAELPGIGPYSSAAIASIAFDAPAVPVDGNVERVLSRLLRIEDALPAGKPAFRAAALRFEDPHRPGDFAQALMDLGSTICTPRAPKCDACPWATHCASLGHEDIETFPRKTPKKLKPIRYGVAFVHINETGILVDRRPQTGLLAGMLGVPSTPWHDEVCSLDDALIHAPIADQNWQARPDIRHIFTHFDLRLEVLVARVAGRDNAHRVALDQLERAALPSVMMKVIRAALNSTAERGTPSGAFKNGN
jgi:A/G-specific adenine glycosylase